MLVDMATSLNQNESIFATYFARSNAISEWFGLKFKRRPGALRGKARVWENGSRWPQIMRIDHVQVTTLQEGRVEG